MKDQIFRDLLDWFMISDPWPGDLAMMARLEGFLNEESCNRGFGSWVHAYHEFKV